MRNDDAFGWVENCKHATCNHSKKVTQMKLGIVTDSLAHLSLDEMLDTVAGLGIAWHFDQVLGHREEFPHKPDPTSARWLLAQLGVRPEQALYVGDTAIDVATARRAALTSIAVTWGFRSRAELIASAPDHLVDHPAEILPIFRAG